MSDESDCAGVSGLRTQLGGFFREAPTCGVLGVEGGQDCRTPLVHASEWLSSVSAVYNQPWSAASINKILAAWFYSNL
jgi:hypothetical protein